MQTVPNFKTRRGFSELQQFLSIIRRYSYPLNRFPVPLIKNLMLVFLERSAIPHHTIRKHGKMILLLSRLRPKQTVMGLSLYLQVLPKFKPLEGLA